MKLGWVKTGKIYKDFYMSKKSSSPTGATYSYSGYNPGDVANYNAAGDTQSVNTNFGSTATPSLMFRSAQGQGDANADTQIISRLKSGLTDFNNLDTLTAVYNRRMELIKQRQAQPGLMQTRGEV